MDMFSKALKNLVPYTAGEQPRDSLYVKLNTNENPYPPPAPVKAMLQTLDVDRLRLYPDPLCRTLREKLGKLNGVPADMVFTANGSDEALSFCFFAFFDGEKGCVLFPDITYSFYPVYCNFYRLPYRTLPVSADFSIDAEAFIENAKISSGIIFPNPNAPTGMYLEPDRIASLLERYPKDKAVVIDEAYIDFGGVSSAGLLGSYTNLVIVRTFSKGMSLAGLRLGYVLASPEAVNALIRVKDSFNSYPVDYITQELASAACDNPDYFKEIQMRIRDTRDNFTRDLRALGWNVLPSRANFIFASKDGLTGKEIYSKFREQNILVRHFNIERISHFVRITIGTPADMDLVLKTAASLWRNNHD